MNLLCASAKKSRKGEMLVVAAAQTGANTIMQTETERGHWHAIKSLVRVGWWRLGCVIF
jgi:hypothetical protein